MLRFRSMMKTFGGIRRWLVASLVVTAALAVVAPAQAAPVQFAQFNQTAANQPFSFTNNGGVSGTAAYNSTACLCSGITTFSPISSRIDFPNSSRARGSP